MYAAERHRAIVALLRERDRVSVTGLAQRFGVTTETIRRDLEQLDERGLVQRVHGGAVPRVPDFAAESALLERQGLNTARKAAIAQRALAFVPPAGGSMLLDAGTSTGTLAISLPEGEALPEIITNSVAIASLLSARDAAEVLLLGGRVRGITQSVVGTQAVEAIGRLRVDVAFMGANGVSLGHGFSTPDVDEAAVKRAMIAAARQVVALVDSSKLGAETLHSFARLEDVDVLITDAGLPAEARAKLSESGLEVVLA